MPSVQIVPDIFGIVGRHLSRSRSNAPVVRVIVLIHQFRQHVYILQGIGRCKISIQFGFDGSIESFDDASFDIFMYGKVMNVLLFQQILKELIAKFLSFICLQCLRFTSVS